MRTLFERSQTLSVSIWKFDEGVLKVLSENRKASLVLLGSCIVFNLSPPIKNLQLDPVFSSLKVVRRKGKAEY